MAKRKKSAQIPRILILLLILSGVTTIILKMIARKMQVAELNEIAGYAGTVFAVSLLIIILIWTIREVNKR
jgi:protein-S-isoprenylcysteine O-methyltransferase Ste14